MVLQFHLSSMIWMVQGILNGKRSVILSFWLWIIWYNMIHGLAQVYMNHVSFQIFIISSLFQIFISRLLRFALAWWIFISLLWLFVDELLGSIYLIIVLIFVVVNIFMKAFMVCLLCRSSKCWLRFYVNLKWNWPMRLLK